MVDDLSGEMQAMAVEGANDPPVEVNAVEERPIIDEMIARMQHEQDQRLGGDDQRTAEEGERGHNRQHRAERRDGQSLLHVFLAVYC